MTTTATMHALDETRAFVRAESVYDTDLDDLWEACTSPERLARWIGEASGDLREGGTIHLSLTSTWTGPARVETCERPHHLLVVMEPGTEDETELEAWLSEDAGGARLVVEERGLPRAKIHFYGAGWHAHLDDLARSLAGQESAWQATWDELTPSYAAMPLV